VYRHALNIRLMTIRSSAVQPPKREFILCVQAEVPKVDQIQPIQLLFEGLAAGEPDGKGLGGGEIVGKGLSAGDAGGNAVAAGEAEGKGLVAGEFEGLDSRNRPEE
jgi:hypothetical protein